MTSEPSFTTYHWAMVQFKEPEAGTLRTTHMTDSIWGPGSWVDGSGPSGLLWLKYCLPILQEALNQGAACVQVTWVQFMASMPGRLSPAREHYSAEAGDRGCLKPASLQYTQLKLLASQTLPSVLSSLSSLPWDGCFWKCPLLSPQAMARDVSFHVQYNCGSHGSS